MYKFSIIMPVYNTEKYLSDAIESIVAQSIGFESNIQLILVNDGSTDNSDEICVRYRERYPQNVIYIQQENSGVSSARNRGMKYVQGKYVNFCDSDDFLNADVCEKVFDFFEKHENEIDIVAIRMRFFEAREGFGHQLDYKYKENTIVDLYKKYSYIHSTCGNTFFKATAIKGRGFDNRIKYGEDTKFINEILLEKMKYGILKDVIYNYRKRLDKTSLTNNALMDKEWYFNSIRYLSKELIVESKEKYEIIPQFIQYLIMYLTKVPIINNTAKDVLNSEEFKTYIDIIVELLQDIDDKIIFEQRKYLVHYKKYTYDLKHNVDVKFTCKKGKLYIGNHYLYDLAKGKIFYINSIHIIEKWFKRKRILQIEGEIFSIFNKKEYTVYFEDERKNKYHFEFNINEEKKVTGVTGKQLRECRKFKILIPFNKIKQLKLMFKHINDEPFELNMVFNNLDNIDGVNKSYYITESKNYYSEGIRENALIGNEIVRLQQAKDGIIG